MPPCRRMLRKKTSNCRHFIHQSRDKLHDSLRHGMELLLTYDPKLKVCGCPSIYIYICGCCVCTLRFLHHHLQMSMLLWLHLQQRGGWSLHQQKNPCPIRALRRIVGRLSGKDFMSIYNWCSRNSYINIIINKPWYLHSSSTRMSILNENDLFIIRLGICRNWCITTGELVCTSAS